MRVIGVDMPDLRFVGRVVRLDLFLIPQARELKD